MASEFHVSSIVTILAISLFVEGLGLGPLLVGPLSEVYGRNIVHRVSYGLFFIFAWPVAFAPNVCECAFILGLITSPILRDFFRYLPCISVHFWALRCRLSQRSWRERQRSFLGCNCGQVRISYSLPDAADSLP